MTAAPGAKIILGRRRPEDHEALERMYAGVFGVGAARRSRDRWRWQYEENPHCPPEGPEIWVAKEAGRILGQYATMPVRLKVKDRILRASWGMDVMVRPDLQRQGIGSRLFLYWDQHVEASLGLGLSVASYTLFKKLQWEDVGPVPCYTRILDPAAVMARRIGERPARLLAPLGRAVLGLAFPTRVSRAAEAAVDVTRLEAAFGEDFDRLWDRASSSYDFITERRADYLEWKFRKVPYL
ncbi:MAG: GNAT family N-acetyltransferase, partial [Acidobacteriota bacterium]